MDLRTATSRFLSHLRDGRRVSSHTLRAYGADLQCLGAWLRKQGHRDDVASISPARLEEFLAAFPELAVTALLRRLNVISSLFRFLARRGLASGNPVDGLDRPRRPRREPQHLGQAEIERLLRAAHGGDDQVLLLTLLYTGVRRAELLPLDVGDVDLAEGRLHVRQGKGSKDRVVPLVPELVAVLRTHLDGCSAGPAAPLFLGGTGRRLTKSALQRSFQRLLADAGLADRGFTLHSLRHTAATRWLNAGLSIHDVQRLLGHADISVTALDLHGGGDEIAGKLCQVSPSLGTQPPPALPDLPEDWAKVLARLSPDQSDALLNLARQMVEPSAGPAGDHGPPASSSLPPRPPP
jgi:site-specific recombinase XerD